MAQGEPRVRLVNGLRCGGFSDGLRCAVTPIACALAALAALDRWFRIRSLAVAIPTLCVRSVTVAARFDGTSESVSYPLAHARGSVRETRNWPLHPVWSAKSRDESRLGRLKPCCDAESAPRTERESRLAS